MSDKTHYFCLRTSETAIFQAASNIYAAYVASNQVTDQNQAQLMERSIDAAIDMARTVDHRVQSDKERPA